MADSPYVVIEVPADHRFVVSRDGQYVRSFPSRRAANAFIKDQANLSDILRRSGAKKS